MSFLEKKDPTVINIKLTSKGREMLSMGKLKFVKYAIGDSEIDYRVINDNNIDPNNISVLKAMDKNSDIISYLKKDESSDKYNLIGNVPSNVSIVTNSSKEYGFVKNNSETGNDEIIIEPTHVKQPNIVIKRSELNGSREVNLYQSANYQTNIAEPEVGDILVIKYDSNDNIINRENPKPILFYKISSIKSGTLANNNLVVVLDRNTPNFSGNGGAIEYMGIVLPYSIELIFENTYSTDYISNEVFSFITNIQQPIGEIPFWNLSIVFNNEIEGTRLNDRLLKSLPSSKYSSFISYIQNFENKYNKLGIIHYTNQLPTNVYGEGLFDKSPTLKIPTVSWHKSNEKKIGVILSADGSKKRVNGLEIDYYDLSDEYGNIVGKVFNTLKIFIIEDQELLYAMSYKSNRSWTLPKPTANQNIGIGGNELVCNLAVNILGVSPTNGGDGKIVLTNLSNNIGLIYVEVRNQIDNSIVYMSEVDNFNEYEISVPVGSYLVKVIDSGIGNCNVINNINII